MYVVSQPQGKVPLAALNIYSVVKNHNKKNIYTYIYLFIIDLNTFCGSEFSLFERN